MTASTGTGDAAASGPSAAVDAAALVAAEAAADAPAETGPRRVAVIFAHPDDAEFICAGTVAKWASEGHHVMYVLLTSGDKGSDDPEITPERLVAIREREQRDACDLLGVKEVHFMRRLDGSLVADMDLRRDIVRVIRRLKPDVVICQDPTVRYVEKAYINHPDHRAAGDATLDAIFPAARNRMTFPELLEEGLEPHRADEIWLAGSDAPDTAVDITGHIDTKIAALRAHKCQLGDWDPDEMIRTWSRETAARFPDHGEYAEAFRTFKLD